MEISIALALIAAVAGLLSSVWTMRRQHQSAQTLAELEHQLDVQARAEERQLAAKEQLDKYREPLIAAAEGLLYRIATIREGKFDLYFEPSAGEWRSRVAMLGTLFRFARYWHVVEQLAQSVNQLRFDTEAETRSIADLLTTISTTFGSDDPAHGGRSLMVWREEQRGIAELMRSGNAPGDLSAIGFATFVDIYDSRLKAWFAELENGLRSPEIRSHVRLTEIQRLLDQLIAALKQGRSYTIS